MFSQVVAAFLSQRPLGVLQLDRIIMNRIALVFGWMIVFASPFAGVVQADLPRLRYLIQTLGNAESAGITRSDDQDGYVFCLEYQLGSWARFNWPIFEPVPSSQAVAFRARPDAAEPAAVIARVMTDDGNQWQGPQIPLQQAWTEVHLQASDFRFFRGSDSIRTKHPDLGQAVQFQIVPATSDAQGTGRLWIDQIRFLPDGPRWSAEGDELRPPPDPFIEQWQRASDLVRRWDAEHQRLQRQSLQTDLWVQELNRLIADGATPAGQRRALERLADQAMPWQQPPETPQALAETPAISIDAYRDLVQARQTPPVSLIEFSADTKLSLSQLYAAPQQSSPTFATIDGVPAVRHEIRFSDADAQQVVFTVLPFPDPVDLEGQRIRIRMRCTARSLNAELPLVLRLYTESVERGESWADLAPDVMPGDPWTEVLFDVAHPVRSVRSIPARTRSIGIRVENTPGTSESFTLELADVRVVPPDAVTQVRRDLLGDAEARVAAARNELYALRDRVAQLEDRLREKPDVRHAYLASFECPLPWSGEPVELSDPSPIDAISLPEASVRPTRVRTQTVRVGGRPALWIEGRDLPAGSQVLADLHDRAGRLLAVGSGPASGWSLMPEHVLPWEPGQPHTYTVRCLVLSGDQTYSYSQRLVGLRTAEVRVGGPDALLRHATQRGQPDWSYQINGRSWFPRVAAYHWPDTEQTMAEGVRMFGDLWMDGVRRYGFALQPDEWDRFSEQGLGMFTSLAPTYRSLQGWDDVQPWVENYQQDSSRAIPFSDSPHQLMAQSGNEAELTIWGAALSSAFPDAPYQPLDLAAQRLAQVVRPNAPVMYVRASSFRQVPPLPHEQVSGVNQYTGRYSGRMEDIDRNLAELSRQALWADRPVMITEWMGPKYSWASTGVGGVTRRGAAHYLQRYWRAMIDTPGIIGSAEFTLNWVIGPFEDLTNQTREQAWKDRPAHSQFGGGRTADHIPQVGPGQAVRSEPTFRAMQAFHGPLFLMVNRPGPILIAGRQAERIAAPLRRFRDGIKTVDDPNSPDVEQAAGHVLRLLPEDSSPSIPPNWEEPVFQTRLNPADPDGLLTSLSAASPEAAGRGVERLVQAAEALAELNRLEGAMTRAVAVTDARHRAAYDNYLLEFAARGYLVCGDDVRQQLESSEFFDTDGKRRPAWQDLSAVILDTQRELEATELELIERLTDQGANLLISAPCYAANPELTRFLDAQLQRTGTLADPIPVAKTLREPVPVQDLGSIDRDVIHAFRADMADAPGLDVFSIRASEVQTLARDPEGRAVIVQRPYGQGRVTLLGTSIGAAIEVHRRVTRSGVTHPLYDRDTASGLERLSRVVVNLCRAGCQAEQYRPRLYVRVTPETTWVPAGAPVRLTVTLTDVAGQPVAGQLRARVRTMGMHRSAGNCSGFIDLVASSSGHYDIHSHSADQTVPTAEGVNLLPHTTLESAPHPHVFSIDLKAYSPNHIPANAATTVLLAPGRRDP